MTPRADSKALSGLNILLVEDEYFIADDLRDALETAGATVFGPIGRVAHAIDLVRGTSDRIDAAIIDIDLHGEKAYGLAALLRERAIPFMFASGYAEAAVPKEYADVIRWEKPYSTDSVIDALSRLALLKI